MALTARKKTNEQLEKELKEKSIELDRLRNELKENKLQNSKK